MTIDQFCALHPNLYHMATSDSLDQIRKHGLLSTNAILDLVGTDSELRKKLTTQRRPMMTSIVHETHGKFTLRDQKPLRDAALESCLDGVSVTEWHRSLNSRVFMWASKERVERLLAARAYRSQDQLLLTINSNALLTRYYDRIQVSTINSGATLFRPVRRGIQTFINLSQQASGKGTRPVAEVTVPSGIPDIRDFIVKAEIREALR